MHSRSAINIRRTVNGIWQRECFALTIEEVNLLLCSLVIPIWILAIYDHIYPISILIRRRSRVVRKSVYCPDFGLIRLHAAIPNYHLRFRTVLTRHKISIAA